MGVGSKDERRLHGLWAVSERVVHLCQAIVILAAELLVVASILVATWLLYALFTERVVGSLGSIDTLGEVQSAVEHVFAGQKHRRGLFIRTIGIARARIKIGMANLAYNFQRLAWLEGRGAPA